MKKIEKSCFLHLSKFIKGLNAKSVIKNVLKNLKGTFLLSFIFGGTLQCIVLFDEMVSIPVMLSTFIETAIPTSIVVTVFYGTFDMIKAFKQKKQFLSKDINDVVQTLNENDLNISDNSLKNAVVKTVSETKTTTIHNSDREKTRKVINYIGITEKDKLIILKELITENKKYDSFNPLETCQSELYLLDEKDKIDGEFIRTDGSLRDKGLALKYGNTKGSK